MNAKQLYESPAMSTILMLLQFLLPHISSPAEHDEAYLGQSVDHYDFERRMREIDERDR